MDWKKEYYPGVVIILGIGLIGLSGVTGFDFSKGPDVWLTEWTAWVASYVALAVAAYSIVKLADGTKTFLENWHLRYQKDQSPPPKQSSSG